MSQADPFISEIQFDNRLGSYASFFDHPWATKFLDASKGTRLYEAAHDLCLDWKGIALSVRMPWLMIHSLEGFHEGFTRTHPAFWQRLSRAFGEYVAKQSSLSNMRKKELIGIVDALGQQVTQEMEEQKPPIDPDKIWAEYLEIEEMGWALWSSQRTAYGSLYFSYENYLRTAIGTAKNDIDYRAFVKTLRRDFAAIFGDSLAAECIDDPKIEIARLVRHCLTHNGGRQSKELKAKTHKIRLTNDRLQIFPEDVRSLFSLLTYRVLKVATAAQTLAAFKTTP